MRVTRLMLPLLLTGALLVGCDDRTTPKSSDATTDAKAADAKAAANKDAADAKAAANKAAANAKADADKAAANTRADADKAAANAKADADKAAANAAGDRASKLLADLQTAVTGQKWTDARTPGRTYAAVGSGPQARHSGGRGKCHAADGASGGHQLGKE